MTCRDARDGWDGWDRWDGTAGRPQPDRRFDDDLLGLDPDDPEVQAFVAHRDRMELVRPGFTVEGYLADVTDFADSANRAGGERRLAAVLVVALILLGAGFVVWEALMFVITTFVR